MPTSLKFSSQSHLVHKRIGVGQFRPSVRLCSFVVLGIIFAFTPVNAQSGRRVQDGRRPTSTPTQVGPSTPVTPTVTTTPQPNQQRQPTLQRQPTAAQNPKQTPVPPTDEQNFGPREMKGGDVHYFPLPMRAGEYCEITVEQKGIDVVIELIEPSGKRRGEIDGYTGASGNESTFVATRESGAYRLEIRALEADSPLGTYVVATGRRNATPEDHSRDLASRIARASSDAEVDALLANRPGLVNYALASQLYRSFHNLYLINIPRTQILFAAQQLFRIAEQLKLPGAYGMAHRAIGNAYGNVGQVDLAIENLNKAALYFEKVSFSSGVADALFSAAFWYRNKGETQRAIEYFGRSITHFVRDSRNIEVIRAQNLIASCNVSLGNFPEAYRVLENSLRLVEVLDNPELKFTTLMQLGSTYDYEGRFIKSLEPYRAAYALAEQANKRSAVASSSFAIAASYKAQGDMFRSYSYFVRAAAIHDSVSNLQGSNSAIMQMAELFRKTGQVREAAESYERALKRLDVLIRRSRGYSQRAQIGNKAFVLNRLANLKLSEGDIAGSTRTLEQAAALLDSVVVGPEPSHQIRPGAFEHYRAMRAFTYFGMGDVYVEMKRFADARAQYLKALELVENLKSEGGIIETLLSLSSLALREGDPTRSIEYSLKLANLLKGKKLDFQLRLYTNLGRAYRDLKNIPETEKALGEAIRIAELIRSDNAVKDLGATYSSSLLEPFDEYIEFLMDSHAREPSAGYDRRAFEMSERRRARALLDALNDARREISRGADPALIEKENQILNQINEAARKRDPFSQSESPLLPNPEDPDVGKLQPPETDIALLISEHKRIQTAIRARSPKYAALTQPEPANLAVIDTLLDTETVVLNYTLGENRSYLWAISKGSVSSYTLPAKIEIEASVKKVYKYLSDGASADSATAQNDFINEASRLSKSVLGPVSTLLTKKRVVIVADGALQYVPFASLPDPRQSGYVPMFSSNEVVFAPSLSVISVLRNESSKRAPASKSIAIFADPVFSENDERLTMKPEEIPANTESVTRALMLPKRFNSANSTDPYPVPRLPYSRREGEAIFAIAAPGTSSLAIDFDASRERAINRELSGFKLIHFATHGVLNSEVPELSGLVLSLVNRKGEQVNGFLRLNEIYNMELNADLVVLSACETALGKEVRGEGLIGLTRGFMYAGAPRVVASLWKVDDVATAEFMKIFYQKMLNEKMRPAAALTAAKIEMSKSKRWAEPYYWAAFELQGDWQ